MELLRFGAIDWPYHLSDKPASEIPGETPPILMENDR